MKTRLFAAVFAIFIFFALHSYIGNKYFPKYNKKTPVFAPQSTATPIVSESAKATEQSETTSICPVVLSEQNALTAHIGEFVITYSKIGGYIQTIESKQHKLRPNIFTDIGYNQQYKDIVFETAVTSQGLVFTNGNFRKEYVFYGNTLTIKNSQPTETILFHNLLITNGLEQRFQEVFYSKDTQTDFKPIKKSAQKLIDNADFVGAKVQYFCISTIKGTYNIRLTRDTKTHTVEALLIDPLPEITLYLGSMSEHSLKEFELQKIIHYGFFHSIGSIIARLLIGMHGITKSWGISIMLLAFILYLILFPFTSMSTKSMKRMQALQPEMERLKQKYKDEPQKMNQEVMKLYKDNKVNPLGGCLPLFFQMPVFFALYEVFLKTSELQGASFLWIKDLSGPDHLIKTGLSAPVDFINIIPILVAVVGVVQQKLTMQATATQEQKQMGLIFAVLIGFVFYNFPSSLVLYWFVQNLLTLLYQYRLSKTA